MADYLYRFRSIKYILKDKSPQKNECQKKNDYQELEKQEICFSGSSSLNDPMDGFKNIIWHGDKILWRNLLKHYLLCLDHIYSLSLTCDQIMPEDYENLAFKSEDNLPTEQWREIIQQIYTNFFSDSFLEKHLELLASSGGLSRGRLLLYLQFIHIYAINKIEEVYEKIINSERIWLRYNPKYRDSLLQAEKYLALIPLLSLEHPQIASEMAPAILLSLDYALSDKEKLICYFPNIYLKLLERLVHFPSYIACFSEDYTNPSMWSHYADQHKGICLKFKQDIGCLKKVTYSERYPEIDFFISMMANPIGILEKYWYQDEQGNISPRHQEVFKDMDKWREQAWAKFYEVNTTKLNDWAYEKEWREVLTSFSESPKFRIKKYDFEHLSGIIFGIQTSPQDKREIIDIIKDKCQSHSRITPFEFYQAYYQESTGKIGIVPLHEK